MFIPRRRAENFASWALIPIAGVAGIFHELEIPQKIPIPGFRGLLGPWSMQTIRLLPGQKFPSSQTFAVLVCHCFCFCFRGSTWMHGLPPKSLETNPTPILARRYILQTVSGTPSFAHCTRLQWTIWKALLIQGPIAILHQIYTSRINRRGAATQNWK